MTILLDTAAVCIVGATLVALKTVLVPISFAVMLAAVLRPPSVWLENRGLPRLIAMGLVSIGAAMLVVFGTSIMLTSAEGFLTALPSYTEQLNTRFEILVHWLAHNNIHIEGLRRDTFAPDTLLSTAGTLLSSIASLASNALMIVLLGMFMLYEADGLAHKAVKAFGDGPTSDRLRTAGQSLQSYVGLKTLTSGLTGVMVAAGLGMIGLPHAILWGFVAFLLNYIPNVGSIIAAIPPILLALVVGGVGEAALVTGLYLMANLLIGSILEPRLMGDSLGLSPLVVLLALLLWGWMWGAAGMLLSVPLTVLLCEFMAINPTTQWIADLLGPNPRPDT
ncbi:MAG: AI-2E family transporter [Myxococcota bacterium]